MKLYKLFLAAFAGLAFVACSDIDNIAPQSGTMLQSQVQEVNLLVPSRAEASFTGMFTNFGKPYKMYSPPDDWEFLMILFCNDLEGADAWIADSGYNWFSVCGEYSSRNADYRNPAIRYRAPYNMIADVNSFISGYPEDVSDAHALNMIAQAKCLRAYSYMSLASGFQFGYAAGGADKPCVPIVTNETTDFTQNPRATLAEVYACVLEDLNWAIEKLGADRSTKAYINQNVAYGLRARVNLAMEKWADAAADAEKAAQGFTPASIDELSRPAFYNIEDHNWIWGYDMTAAVAKAYLYATTSAWLRSFSGDGYAPACQCYTSVNNLLYNMIPATDVRKGWWVDENLHSDHLNGVTWSCASGTLTGNDIATKNIDDIKMPYIPYTNVKFGFDPQGDLSKNGGDWPIMRVEEMILIQAEAYAKAGDEAKGKQILSDFVKQYRNPEYTQYCKTFSDEVWMQRRIELWGEGFSMFDIMRLRKPVVRVNSRIPSNFPDAFQFNLAHEDPIMLAIIPQSEMTSNALMVQNPIGHEPTTGDGEGLLDGVTD